MTYQQQPGQYGGYQQQQPTGQYGYDPYGQYPQYGYPGGGYGPPPPPKRNTGAVVAVVVAVLAVVAGLGITGFVAPGFFLSDDKNDNNAGGGGTETSQPSEDGGDAAAFIDRLVAAADDKDRGTLSELSCADAEPNVEEAIRDIDEISGAELTDTEEVSDEEVRALVDITVDDETGTFETLVVKADGDWCWQDITLEHSPDGGPATAEVPTAAPAEPAGDSSEGVALVEDFLIAINVGDSDAATGMLCSDSSSRTDVTDAISNGAELAVDEGTLHSDEGFVGANLVGELNGAPVSTSRTTAFNESEGWCVLTFYVY